MADLSGPAAVNREAKAVENEDGRTAGKDGGTRESADSQKRQQDPPGKSGSGDEDSGRPEDEETKRLASLAARAKDRGNAAFKAGDFNKAAAQYSLAIQLGGGTAVLHR